MPAEPLPARLRVFRATDDRAGCEKFHAAHLGALDHHHLSGITSAEPAWFDDAGTHVVLLEATGSGKALSGMRVQIAGGAFELPTVKAYRDGPEVRDYVDCHLAAGIGIGEVCGAWADHRVAKTQVFPFVSCAGFALLAPLGARVALLSCSVYTRQILTDLGLRVETDLGRRGMFFYPTPDNLSFFMVLRDSETFAGALAAHRETIFDLRARPRQRRSLAAGPFTVEVDVDLAT